MRTTVGGAHCGPCTGSAGNDPDGGHGGVAGNGGLAVSLEDSGHPGPGPTRGRNRRRRRSRPGKKRGARLLFATLNMRGYGPTTGLTADEKWLRINQLIRDRRIAVLALQETHLTPERMRRLNDLFGASMVVHGSADPDSPTAARGVTFVVNKRIVSTPNVVLREIMPGRALALSLSWDSGRVLTLLNTYAPNHDAENAAFWSKVDAECTRTACPALDVVLGDFNVVERALDRLPPHPDALATVQALQSFLRKRHLVDGLRESRGDVPLFTYLQRATGSQSRIDRAYLQQSLAPMTEDWDISPPGFSTDHQVLSFSIANYDAPSTGKGRWAFPNALLTDTQFSKTLRSLVLAAQGRLNAMRTRTEAANPQRILHDLKVAIRSAARERAKQKIPSIRKVIAALKRDLVEASMRASNAVLSSERTDGVRDAGILQDRIAELEMKCFSTARNSVALNAHLKGETISKYWTRLNAAP
ncbi:Endonuclease/exonuclease/phosphatase, partial [Daedaleopsis nitida]